MPITPGFTLPPVSSTGNPIYQTSIFTGPPGAKAISLCTPNLGDRTTWYQKSVNVQENLTDSGDGLTFNSSNVYWIDITNEKLTYTYNQIPTRSGTWSGTSAWLAVISINGTPVTTGYTINFAAGTVTFSSSQSGNTISANYWTNNNVTTPSEWLFTPTPGDLYTIETVELQYSMNLPPAFSTIRFEIWAGGTLSSYGSFSQDLYSAGYGQFRADYRNVWDIINVTNNQSSTVIPAHGGMMQDIFIAPFNYTQAIQLNSLQGTLMRLCLVGDVPIADVEIATATFYLQILPAPSTP